MAEHRNNEPYLHFKAYSNKDNNGLGSQGKKELRMVYERDRERLSEKESVWQGKSRGETDAGRLHAICFMGPEHAH